ncbi:SDR family NAD(P)-dependent oxidoreductase [Geomicrobium sp. JCM 19039]|uniref:SDR family NAD(P)-dependent oxidoreductase n=1 Tax=Geomicrobium sp. JCM 19039 TaxID=1460636 RepID=UPI00045F3E01|nr:SDR family oxidoreductase [Geomicrobium sp. JCM 19039]GAK11813.1 3-oxoacyl-[acyl-carrier protein] reductase [Geomicrobium sp. JCM 19039]
MELNVKAKKVLVTGGSRGIGKAIAEAFIHEGATVGVSARNERDLVTAAKDIGGSYYVCDLSSYDDRERLMETFIREQGTIDILINNAGASIGSTVMNTPVQSFEQAMQINYIAPLHLAKLAASEMETNGGGVIVNVASIYGRESGGNPSYNAAKSALISFTKAFSTEAIAKNIRVCGVAPGAVYHPNEEWTKRVTNDPDFLKSYAKAKIPAGRIGTPPDIASVVLFAASEQATWIVGNTIPVDGGQSRSNI